MFAFEARTFETLYLMEVFGCECIKAGLLQRERRGGIWEGKEMTGKIETHIVRAAPYCQSMHAPVRVSLDAHTRKWIDYQRQIP